MKHNKKGQALIEFILLIPVIVMVVLVIIDVCRVYDTKSDAEKKLDNTMHFILDGYDPSDDEEINYEYYGTKGKVTITKKIELLTPGAKLIVKNPYEVKVSGVITLE